MRNCSASRRCKSIKTFPHSKNAPFPLFFFQKPHKWSNWQTILFFATSQRTSKKTVEHTDSVYRLLTVKHVFSNPTVIVNQGDLVLSSDMDSCKDTPEPFLATIKMARPLKQAFEDVPFERLNFPSCSVGSATKSFLESMQLELTEIQDVRKMDPGNLQKSTEPKIAHYTSLNPATAAPIDNSIPAKTSFLISGGSILLFLFFKTQFSTFSQTGTCTLLCPTSFLQEQNRQLLHLPDDKNQDSDFSSFIMTRDEYTALRAVAMEGLLKHEATAPLTYSAIDKTKYTRTSLHKQQPSVKHHHWFWLPTLQLQRLHSIPNRPPQSKYPPQVMYHSVYMYKVQKSK